ncbi:hypothetical protein AB1Y20_000747 [Prymnesium parvum]|uniref:PHD-type domain-containing protein n=1 Tax=Prymnesium parvum TaxID=97485 RepID=A0AB34K6C2_PRYPA
MTDVEGPTSKRERSLQTAGVCAFCHEGEDSDDPDDDPIVLTNAIVRSKPVYAHEECLAWCPDLYQSEDLTWQNVGKALHRCHRLKCAVCGEGDAPLGCKRAACKKNWHYPCAMEPTTGLVIYEDLFCVACPVCHEVLEARRRKKERIAAEAAAEKATKAAAEKATKAAASKACLSKAKVVPKAASGSAKTAKSSGLPGLASAIAATPGASLFTKQSTSTSKAVLPSHSKAMPEPRAGQPRSTIAVCGAQSLSNRENTSIQTAATTAPPRKPPTPEETEAAERFERCRTAVGEMFRKLRCDELKKDIVAKELRASPSTSLNDDELDTLLTDMERENLVMARIGIVFLI